VTRAVALTLTELDQLEAIVRGGLQSFMAVGLALIEIRETKGYQLRGHQTFESYCAATFGFSATHGRRMMVAAKTAHAVAAVTGDRPRNEASARALAPVRDNPEALRQVKDRLAVRGETIATAPGLLIESILLNTKLFTGRPKLHSAPERAGRCPACGQIPSAFRHLPDEKAFECAACHARVVLLVTVKAPADHCPRCSMKFDKEDVRAEGKGYCTYCAEEIGRSVPAMKGKG
jgi:hypothetical protein